MINDRDFRYALLGTSSISVLGYYIYAFPPDTSVHIAILFTIIALTVFSWTYYIVPVRRIAFLTTGFVVTFLLLRILKLHHPIYILLLLSTIVSLELIRNKR